MSREEFSNRYKQQIQQILDGLYETQQFSNNDDVESIYNGNLVSRLDFTADYQHLIDRQIQIYEICQEVIPEPVLYEIPVAIAEKSETKET